MKKLLLYVCVLVILTGCSKVEEKTKYEKIIEKDNYVVINVRTYSEYIESHVVNSINIPYDQIDSSITIDKKKDILVYCKSGKRSQIAAQKLTELGYNVYDMGAFSKVELPKE